MTRSVAAAGLLALLLAAGAPGRSGPGSPDPGLVGPELPDTARLPVLVVPGWGDEPRHLEPLVRRLRAAGWGGDSVMALAFRDPVGSNRDHAGEVAGALEEMLDATGAPAADVVAHSMGGLAVRWLLARGGEKRRIRRVVFLATPQRGTVTAFLAWGEGGDEMEPGSAFLDSLNAAPVVPGGVEALAIRTPLDLRVLPGESARLPSSGSTDNAEVCCPTHAGLLDDPEAFRIIRSFLLSGETP